MTTPEKPSLKTSSGSPSPEPRPEAKGEEQHPAAPKAEVPETQPGAFERRPRPFGKPEASPKLETPERKYKAPPEETPRDEESELETPEEPREFAPPVPPVAEVKVAPVAPTIGAAEPTFRLKPQKPVAPTSLPADVAALFDHVASNPVDSHAPAWTVHTPNTKGGYS